MWPSDKLADLFFLVVATEITDVLQGLKECNEDLQVFIPFQQ